MKTLRFLAGGLVGGIVGLAVLLALDFAALRIQARRPVSLALGERLLAKNPYLLVTQVCRGACDEIKL